MKRFFMFDLLITSWLIRILYVIGQIALIIISWQIADELYHYPEEIALWIIFVIISIPLWRIVCEVFIVVFKISENLSAIKEHKGGQSPEEESTIVCKECGFRNLAERAECFNCGKPL